MPGWVATVKRWQTRETAWTGGNVQRQDAKGWPANMPQGAALFKEQRATGSVAVEMEDPLVWGEAVLQPAGLAAIADTRRMLQIRKWTFLQRYALSPFFKEADRTVCLEIQPPEAQLTLSRTYPHSRWFCQMVQIKMIVEGCRDR